MNSSRRKPQNPEVRRILGLPPETPTPPEPANDGAMAVVHWRITGRAGGIMRNAQIPGKDPADAMIRHLKKMSKELSIPAYFVPECPMCGRGDYAIVGMAFYMPSDAHVAVGHLLCKKHKRSKFVKSGEMERAIKRRLKSGAMIHVAGEHCQCGCTKTIQIDA